MNDDRPLAIQVRRVFVSLEHPLSCSCLGYSVQVHQKGGPAWAEVQIKHSQVEA